MKKLPTLAALFGLYAAIPAPAADLNRYAFSLQVRGTNGSESYGTGSLVKYKNGTYYITAHHIFGKITDAELQRALKNITFVNEADLSVRVKPEAFLPVANVQDLSKNDLLIFKIRSEYNLKNYTLPMAAVAPTKDETVFLAARIPTRPLSTYSLKILEADDEHVHYEKIPGVSKYTGASGGPIINTKGEFVGTYLGRKVMPDDSIVCLFGAPLKSLTTALDQTGRLTGY
jgi:hypothetical protein